MKIGIDIRCLVEGRRTGVEEYTLNILENLFAIDKKNKYVLFLNSFTRPKFNSAIFRRHKNVVIKNTRWPNKFFNFCLWYFNWPKIDRLIGGVDIIFFPNIAFSAVGRDVKVIQTFHDLSFELHPETFSLKRRIWHFFVNPSKLARRADKIIAVSQSTAEDLKRIYGVEEKKIKVIHSAVPQNFVKISRNDPKLAEIQKKYGLPYKFIFYLGTIEPRKNIRGLVRAFNELKKYQHPEIKKCRLVIAGSSGWKQEEIYAEIKASPERNNIVLPGFIAEEDLPYVYNLASAFAYLSFFEGFGFPPLEAMSCGLPVVVSHNSSLPEIVGEGGLLVDPDRPDEAAKVLKELIINKEFAALMSQKSLSRAKNFHWKKTAEEFLKILNEKIKPKPE